MIIMNDIMVFTTDGAEDNQIGSQSDFIMIVHDIVGFKPEALNKYSPQIFSQEIVVCPSS